jgi:hypothetical protein
MARGDILAKIEKSQKPHFERSPRKLQAEYQKSVLPDFSKYPQDTPCEK